MSNSIKMNSAQHSETNNTQHNIVEVTVKVSGVADGTKCIDVFLVATDDQYGRVTVAYEIAYDEERVVVYDGAVNVEDPDTAPLEEHDSAGSVSPNYAGLAWIARNIAMCVVMGDAWRVETPDC